MKRSKPDMGIVTAPASLTDVARDALKSAIMNRNLKPDHVYSEQAVADQLGISKTPVHHALLELAGKGFLTILPRRGFQVRSFTAQDIRNLFDFRRPLEAAVLATVAPHLTKKEFRDLDKLHDELEQVTGVEDYVWGDIAIHKYFVNLTDNQFFIDALSNIWDMVAWLAVIHLTSDPEINAPFQNRKNVTSGTQEHREVLKALIAKKLDTAISAMTAHLDAGQNRYLSRMGALAE